MPRQQITPAAIFRVLIAGFMLVILLLAAAAVIGVRSVQAIRESVTGLVGEELIAARLIDDIQHEQAALAVVFLKLSRDPEAVDREKVLSDLDQADARMDEIEESVRGTPEEPLWNELRKSSTAFSAEARRLLSLDHPTTFLSRDLFRRHQDAAGVVAKLAAMSHTNAVRARKQIENREGELMRRLVWLLGGCLLFALICAGLTVRMTVGLFRRMEEQTGELSRVSWRLLESQETTARRFSHELHDELGQTLTALKANLHALAPAAPEERARIQDCVTLVNEAISNVRELSQLLHPTILDDFGLDAALRWLAERFSQRTGIEVKYRSEFTGRLPDEMETHLYRICQEALTNVARHSGATEVRIEIEQRGGKLHLLVADNGKGLEDGVTTEARGMGLVGMRARARGAGGSLSFHSVKGKGLTIQVEAPVHAARLEEDPHPVGR
jgi:signal transduction histidine kinase